MTDPDRCPLCGSTRFEQDLVNVGGTIPRYVPGLRSCLDCHDGGAPVLLAEVERLREVEADWERVCEELRNANVAIANLGDRLNLKIDEQRATDAELLRLRGLLARLEWSGQPVPEEGTGRWPMCPACEALNPPWGAMSDTPGQHDPDCWLAAELERRDPPEGPPAAEGPTPRDVLGLPDD